MDKQEFIFCENLIGAKEKKIDSSVSFNTCTCVSQCNEYIHQNIFLDQQFVILNSTINDVAMLSALGHTVPMFSSFYSTYFLK